MQLGSYRDLDYSLGTNEVYTVGSVEKNALSRKIDVGDGKTVEITSDSAAIQAAYFARGNIGAEGTDGG